MPVNNVEYRHDLDLGKVKLQKITLEKLGLEKGLAKEVTEAIKDKIKPPEMIIKGELSLLSYDPNGVDIIKQALKKAEDAGKGQTEVKYKGAGKYIIIVKSDNYKDAEKILKKSVSSAIKFIEKNQGEGSFARSS